MLAQICCVLRYNRLAKSYTKVNALVELSRTALPCILAGLLACSNSSAGDIEDDVLWSLCPADVIRPSQPEWSEPEQDAGSTEIRSDQAELRKEGVQVLSGNVEVIQNDRAVAADSVTYDEAKSLVTVEGNARYWDNSIFWDGLRGELALDEDFAKFESGDYSLVSRRGRGHAELIDVDNAKQVENLRNVDYTTCASARESAPNWTLAAKHLKLDHNSDWGRATGVTLKVRDVPVMYLPFMSFPISDKRKSGFLAPSFGTTTDSGTDIQTPYYWNIAPHVDATIIPRVLGDRGVMLGGQARYLLPRGSSEVNFSVLPSDDQFQNETRYLFKMDHRQHFAGNRAYGEIKYNLVSDKEYFEDFGFTLGVSSTRFLEQRGYLRYTHNWFNVSALLQSYQNVDRSLPGGSRPYKRLPQILLNSRSLGYKGLSLHMASEFVYFDRDSTTVGARIDLLPQVAYPIVRPGYFFIPRLVLRHTEYLLDNVESGDENMNRTLPVASVNAGLFLEREYEIFGQSWQQTLEPRVFYLYVPETNQDDLPLFDTGSYDFSFSQLFRDNRFSGRDRIGDANQMAVALTTRFIDRSTGRERFRASLGQLYYFEDREVTLPDREMATDSTSELIAELAARISDSWRVSADFQWDPHDSQTQKVSLNLRYRPGPFKVLNLGYRVRRERTAVGALVDRTVEQTDVSLRWPITENWSVIGRWNYSIQSNETLESVGGVEYNSCCWGIRAAARRFISTSGGAFDTGIFLQIELKGLAGFGGSARSFLERSVPGYRAEF